MEAIPCHLHHPEIVAMVVTSLVVGLLLMPLPLSSKVAVKPPFIAAAVAPFAEVAAEPYTRIKAWKGKPKGKGTWPTIWAKETPKGVQYCMN